MKKNIWLLPLITLVIIACKKEEKPIGINDIIKEVSFSPTTIEANGSDQSTVYVIFNDKADPSKITLNCTVHNGTISETGNEKISLSPEIDSLGNIFAKFNVISSLVTGSIKVTFEVSNFEMTRTISTTRSVPNSITLSANSFSVENDFNSEITLQGTILNSEGKKVEEGTTVAVSDLYTNGSPVNGFFREEQLSSNSDSQISFIYSPGEIDSNIFIVLRAEVLDENLTPTGIFDTLNVYVK